MKPPRALRPLFFIIWGLGGGAGWWMVLYANWYKWHTLHDTNFVMPAKAGISGHKRMSL